MVRFGIIGAGRMGSNHANCIAELPNAKVTAVYDIRPEASAAMSEKNGAVICNSAGELAARPDVDCVIITSPTYCHQEGIAAAMAANKTIFCEKALCRTKDIADDLLAKLKNYDKTFTVGFVRRHMAKSILVKKLLDEGFIGKVRYCNVDLPLGIYRRLPGDWFADYELCGGVLIDMLAHHVDLANWFFGEPQDVYAKGLLLSKELPRPSDYAASVLTYKNGVICNLMCSWWRSGRTTELMEICGDEGTLIIDGSADVTYYPLEGEKQTLNAETELKKDTVDASLNQVSFGNGFTRGFDKLCRVIEGGKSDLPTIQDAWNSLNIAFAMIESVETGKVVTFK